jgi:hypothetical protein
VGLPVSARKTPLKSTWPRNLLLLLVALAACAVPYWVYAARQQLRHKPIDFNVLLGCEPIPGVEESGFSYQEQFEGRPFRWTNGIGKLVVPIDRKNWPGSLEIDFTIQKPGGTVLQLFVNERKVFDQRVRPGRLAHTLDVSTIDLGHEVTLEIVSDTFVPAQEMPGSPDLRALGVNVKGIRLLPRNAAPAPG